MKHITQTGWLTLALTLSLTAAAQTTTSVTNFTVGMAIPDASASGLASAQMVSSPITSLTGLKVTLKVNGTFNGDLYCYLSHNSGSSVLLNRVGRRVGGGLGYRDNGFDITFDDAAANGDVHVYQLTLNGSNSPINAALTDTWAPDGRTSSPYSVLDTDSRTALLSSFQGTDPNGEWDLFIADVEGGDIATLESWGLEMTGYSAPSIVTNPAPAVITSSSNTNAITTNAGAVAGNPTLAAVKNNSSSLPIEEKIVALTVTQDGVSIRFEGIPGNTYTVQRSTNLATGFWTPIGTVTLPDNGIETFTDTNAPPSLGFYRTARH
jgi:subtilisin-like proprotein convertase family protein